LKTRLYRVIAIATTACVLFAPVRARADDQAIVDAQARFADGLDRARRGDFDGARLAFVQAYSVLHSPDILYNLAVAEQKTARNVEALRHFRQLMHDTRTGNDDRAAAQTKIEQLEKVTAHLRIHAPDGATITVDGEAASLDPDPVVDVLPGAHVVEGRLGAKTARSQASAAAGETAVVTLPIEPDAPRPIVLESPAKGRIPVTLALGAAAVAALGTGIGFAIDSQSKKDDADAFRQAQAAHFCARPSSTCSDYQSMLDDQQRSVTIAHVLYVSSAVLAVGAIGAFVLWPRGKAKSEQAFIAPTFGGARAGFSF